MQVGASYYFIVTRVFSKRNGKYNPSLTLPDVPFSITKRNGKHNQSTPFLTETVMPVSVSLAAALCWSALLPPADARALAAC